MANFSEDVLGTIESNLARGPWLYVPGEIERFYCFPEEYANYLNGFADDGDGEIDHTLCLFLLFVLEAEDV